MKVRLLFSGLTNFFKGRETDMTVKELIDKVQEEKPNTFDDAKLVSYVNEIESEVAEQLRLTQTPEYNTEELNKSLLLSYPYNRLYVSYLKAQIDYANEEYASYENNAAQHVQDFRDFTDWVVRTGQAEEKSFANRFRNIF